MDYNDDLKGIHGLLNSINDDVETTAAQGDEAQNRAQNEAHEEAIETIDPFIMRTLFWSGTGYGLDLFGKGSTRLWIGWLVTLAVTVIIGKYTIDIWVYDIVHPPHWYDQWGYAILFSAIAYILGVFLVLKLDASASRLCGLAAPAAEYGAQRRKLQMATLNVVLFCGIYIDLYPLVVNRPDLNIGGNSLASSVQGSSGTTCKSIYIGEEDADKYCKRYARRFGAKAFAEGFVVALATFGGWCFGIYYTHAFGDDWHTTTFKKIEDEEEEDMKVRWSCREVYRKKIYEIKRHVYIISTAVIILLIGVFCFACVPYLAFAAPLIMAPHLLPLQLLNMICMVLEFELEQWQESAYKEGDLSIVVGGYNRLCKRVTASSNSWNVFLIIITILYILSAALCGSLVYDLGELDLSLFNETATAGVLPHVPLSTYVPLSVTSWSLQGTLFVFLLCAQLYPVAKLNGKLENIRARIVDKAAVHEHGVERALLVAQAVQLKPCYFKFAGATISPGILYGYVISALGLLSGYLYDYISTSA